LTTQLQRTASADELAERFGIETMLSNTAAAEDAALVVIAVKPQDFEVLLGEIGGTVVGIASTSPNVQQAWPLVKYLTTNTQALSTLAEKLGNVPTTYASLKDPTLAGDPNFMNNVPDPLLSQKELPTFKFALEKSTAKVVGKSTAREASVNELPISKGIAGVSMGIEPGGMRELHWHPNSDESHFTSAETLAPRPGMLTAGARAFISRSPGFLLDAGGNGILLLYVIA